MKYEITVDNGPLCGYIQDIEYARRGANPQGTGIGVLQRPLFMQLLLPFGRREAGGVPLVVFVVGGGFRTPKVHFRVPWLAGLAERGIAVAMPEYRGTTEGFTFPAMVEDVRTAVRYMRAHAGSYGINPDKIVLAGGSAGAHTALLAAYAGSRFDADGDDLRVSAEVRGVIDLYGSTDITKMLPGEDAPDRAVKASVASQLMGCSEQEKLRELLAPTVAESYLVDGTELPPTLIAHGDDDQVVPLKQSELLYDALAAAGRDVDFYVVKGAAHADARFFQPAMLDLYETFVRRVTG